MRRFEDMEREVRRAVPGAVLMLAGEELYQRNRLLKSAMEAYAGNGFEPVRLDCADMEAGDLGRAFTEESLFSGQRLILVLSPMALRRSAKSELLEHLGSLGGNAAVVVTDRTRIKSGTLAKIARLGSSYVCYDPWERDFPGWVGRLAGESGVSLGGAAAATLAAHAGGSLSRLASALQALSLYYLDDDRRLDADDVRRVLAGSADCDIFDLGDRVMADRRSGALDALRSLLRAGEEPVAMLSYLYSHWCRVAGARALLAGRGNNCNIGRELGVAPFLARKLKSHAASYAGTSVSVAAEAFASADESLKTGGDPYTVLAGLVLVLTS